MSTIKQIQAREVLDSRGFPTVEVEVTLENHVTGKAIVPSGASTGEGEALELRDGDKKRYLGKGVLKAVTNVKEKIAPAILGREFALPSLLDDTLLELDGTPNKSKLGANAILGVSMAFVRAKSLQENQPTSQYIAGIMKSPGTTLPVPLMNILNGGKHADNGLAIQEFMIVPVGFKKFSEALRCGVEIFHRLKKILHDKKLSTGVGDEGGFAPYFQGSKPHEQALSVVLQAVEDAGFNPGKEVFLALDCAASEFCSKDGELFYRFEDKTLNSEQMIEIYQQWIEQFPIISIEDGLAENDWEGWSKLTATVGGQCQLVGDDLFVTNMNYLKKGIQNKAANSILIKLNQIGTVTETLETMKLASQSHYSCITSHRSGETEDTFIAELAVGTDCGQIKTGSASRTDRIAKYNQLLRIEEKLGDRARYPGVELFRKYEK